MTLYDEIEEDMNCFYKNDEDDNETEEEKEIVVNDLELAMRRKHTTELFKEIISYFESLNIDDFKGNFTVYKVEIEIPYNLSDELLNEYTDNKFNTATFKEKVDWDKFSKYKWEYVSSLYEAIKNNGGKLYGMNISKEDRAKISLREFDKMSQEEKDFYDNLDLNVTAHKQLIYPYLKHCDKMPQTTSEYCFDRMYRVQVTWDTYMAQNTAKIANKVIKTPKDKLLVFAGALHIEQSLGIPLRFSRLSNLPFISISNEKIENDKDLKIDTNKADFVYIYESLEKKSK